MDEFCDCPILDGPCKREPCPEFERRPICEKNGTICYPDNCGYRPFITPNMELDDAVALIKNFLESCQSNKRYIPYCTAYSRPVGKIEPIKP